MSSMQSIKTPITEMFGLTNPIILAGMNKAAGPKLAAAVSNNGGLGVIGGVNYTPKMLERTIKHLKKNLDHPDLPFGVDLLLPKVGEGARKTNYDYTKGKLDKLIDVVIDSGAKLFVCAVGVPPKRIVDKLHDNNILVMNMVGHPKHVPKALAVGVDLICAQGGEGGGHTGHVPTSLLIPACVDACRGKVSPLTGKPVYVVAAGGISDGRGLAMSLCFGAQAVWVGTRFVASVEAGASNEHKKAVVKATFDDTQRTLIYTGRPMRIIKNEYSSDWENNRRDEMLRNLDSGVVPVEADVKARKIGFKDREAVTPHLCGQVCGAIQDVLPAKVIMERMMSEAVQILHNLPTMISTVSEMGKAKL